MIFTMLPCDDRIQQNLSNHVSNESVLLRDPMSSSFASSLHSLVGLITFNCFFCGKITTVFAYQETEIKTH